jgi:hypothetical protein
MFSKLVQRFHWQVKKAQKWLKGKWAKAKKLHCHFLPGLEDMFVAEDEKVSEPIPPQQQPRNWRAELREELLRTISSTNAQVMGNLLANAGGRILMPGAEEQDYVLEWRTTSTRRSSTLLVATTRRWPSTSALAMSTLRSSRTTTSSPRLWTSIAACAVKWHAAVQAAVSILSFVLF